MNIPSENELSFTIQLVDDLVKKNFHKNGEIKLKLSTAFGIEKLREIITFNYQDFEISYEKFLTNLSTDEINEIQSICFLVPCYSFSHTIEFIREYFEYHLDTKMVVEHQFESERKIDFVPYERIEDFHPEKRKMILKYFEKMSTEDLYKCFASLSSVAGFLNIQIIRYEMCICIYKLMSNMSIEEISKSIEKPISSEATQENTEERGKEAISRKKIMNLSNEKNLRVQRLVRQDK